MIKIFLFKHVNIIRGDGVGPGGWPSPIPETGLAGASNPRVNMLVYGIDTWVAKEPLSIGGLSPYDYGRRIIIIGKRVNRVRPGREQP